MLINLPKIGLPIAVIAISTISSSLAFALPPEATAHAQADNRTNVAVQTDATSQTNDPSQAAEAHPVNQEHRQAAKLKACQNREAAINHIISRINTRADHQLTLFNTIANRVESFYASSGKTVANYDQLTSDINTAKTQAQTDLTTMQANSSFNCSTTEPKGMVTAFQGYLKTEITDLKNYRTAVKNLIVAVAKANGVTVKDSTQTTVQGGQQ